MKKTILFFTISILSLEVQGSSIFVDTTQPQKPWKISKQQFLDKYGKDDTSRTIISYYFFARKRGVKWLSVFSTVIGITTLQISDLNHTGSSIYLGLFFIGAMIISGGFLIGSLDMLTSFPRRTLLKTLNGYFSGKGVPRSLKKIFKSRYSFLRKQ